MNKNLAEKFYKEVLQIKKRFEEIEVTLESISAPEFIQIITDMKKLLSRKKFVYIAESLQNDTKFIELGAELRKIYEQYYFYLEKKAAENLISNKTKDLFLSNNSKLGDEEAKAAKLNTDSCVFYIGSGPFPWTAIRYAKSTGCKVTCIDSDPVAISLSKKLIKKIGMDELIHISEELAQEVDYSQATHIVIAGMAKPKDAILEQIYRISNSDIKIIVRSSYDLYFFMYPLVDKDKLKNFEVNQILDAGSNSELISLILSKKP